MTMGYYIQTSEPFGKARELVQKYNGQIIEKPESYNDIPAGKALIVVVRNTFFEAAGFCHNEYEFNAWFDDPTDMRPMQFVLIDREIAERESGYK